MSNIETPYIVVIGAARSGIAVASLLKRQGNRVFVTDSGAIAPHIKQRLVEEQIPFEENGHTEVAEAGKYAVVSPGVPTSAPIVQEYINSGRSVYSEIEMAFKHVNGRIVAVTGTNGKTTVTSWLDHVWSLTDQHYVTAGNIGNAYSEVVEQTNANSYSLLEVSSFQLDHIDTFRPDISILLNITPDHLDRYNNNFDEYAAAKFRIFENQDGGNWLVYNYDDPVIREKIKQLEKQKDSPRLLPFSIREELPEGAFLEDQELVIIINNKKESYMRASQISLSGKHNLQNGMATALAARAAEIKSEVIRESLKRFEGVEHRLEFVRKLDGVEYINDSKATNINSVWYALDSLDAPAVLIMGGRDKGNDYTELHRLLYEKVHTVIAMGESKEKIKEQVGKVVPNMELAETLEQAVKQAQNAANCGDVVLLSTACASFDMFENFEHRGHEFKKAVQAL